MKIRTVDDKNRVTIAADGKLYSESMDENGVITLYPIVVPTPPKLDRESMRAIYVSRVGYSKFEPTTITLHVGMGNDLEYTAQTIAELADRFQSPIVIESGGLNGPIADRLAELTDQSVIQVNNIIGERETLL